MKCIAVKFVLFECLFTMTRHLCYLRLLPVHLLSTISPNEIIESIKWTNKRAEKLIKTPAHFLFTAALIESENYWKLCSLNFENKPKKVVKSNRNFCKKKYNHALVFPRRKVSSVNCVDAKIISAHFFGSGTPCNCFGQRIW